MRPTLTIAIPTYNRPGKVHDRLLELVVQCPETVELLVVDNASEPSAEDFVIEKSPFLKQRVRFHRNRFNIGLAANICRCYETADGEWIWTLGDDDKVKPDAVVNILTAIEKFSDPEIQGFNFSTGIHTYTADKRYGHSKDYCNLLNNITAFSNALFLSSCVIRASVSQDHLRLGYQYAFSAAPHIAIPFQAISNGGVFMTVASQIVDWEPPEPGNSWNRISVAMSLPVLSDLQHCSEALKQFEPAIIAHAPGGLIGKIAIKRIFSDKGRSPRFWKMYYLRLLPCVSGWNQLRCGFYSLLAGFAEGNQVFYKTGIKLASRIKVDPFDSVSGAERL